MPKNAHTPDSALPRTAPSRTCTTECCDIPLTCIPLPPLPGPIKPAPSMSRPERNWKGVEAGCPGTGVRRAWWADTARPPVGKPPELEAADPKLWAGTVGRPEPAGRNCGPELWGRPWVNLMESATPQAIRLLSATEKEISE